VKVGVGADGVLVGVGENVRWVVTGGCAAISSTTDVYVRSRGGILTGSALPPQASSSTTAVERGSCRILLSFTAILLKVSTKRLIRYKFARLRLQIGWKPRLFLIE
jgi:hypothetical protein